MKDGRVRKKNRHVPTRALALVLDRESAARGFRHVVTKNDLRRFIDLIPDWTELSAGLSGIVLAAGGRGWDGEYCALPRERSGVVSLSAWPHDLWMRFEAWYFEEHSSVFEQLGVASEPVDGGAICRFTSDQARAFMLLHVFLHELGHHHDWMTGRVPRATRRGEAYAEAFALERGEQLFPSYAQSFGDPRIERR